MREEKQDTPVLSRGMKVLLRFEIVDADTVSVTRLSDGSTVTLTRA